LACRSLKFGRVHERFLEVEGRLNALEHHFEQWQAALDARQVRVQRIEERTTTQQEVSDGHTAEDVQAAEESPLERP